MSPAFFSRLSARHVFFAVAAILGLSGCGEREPGPIADLEVEGSIITARSIGERWYEVTESANYGLSWELQGPERFSTDDPLDPNFGLDAPLVELEAKTEVCDGIVCWRVNDLGVERSTNGGTTWSQSYRVPEGRDRFAPADYPEIVDLELLTRLDRTTVLAATAEHGMLAATTDGPWMRRSIDRWTAPDLTGSWVQIWPELTAAAAALAIVLSVLILVVTLLTRRAHEQLAQSVVRIIAVLAILPIARRVIQPIIDWKDGDIIARSDAIGEAVGGGIALSLLALVVVTFLSLAVNYRWSKKLGPLPFPDTPA